MPIETVEIPCNFVGRFKVGDNLVFNSDLLCKLVEENKDGNYNKLIVMQVGSIVEAGLAQIVYRAQNHKREGVPNIEEKDRAEIEGKKVERLGAIIDVLKKYKILDGAGGDIYEQLHKLRKFRNKIHIQEDIDIDGVSPDDGAAFSDEICKWSIELNLRVIGFLNKHLSRPKHLDGYVNPLRLPANAGR